MGKYLSRMEQFHLPWIFHFFSVLEAARYFRDSDANLKTLLRKGLNDSEEIIRKGSAITIARKGIFLFQRDRERVKNASTTMKNCISGFRRGGEADDVLALVQYFQSENQPYLKPATAAIDKSPRKTEA